MANRDVTRQLSIFINDKQVVNSISGIGRAMRTTNNQINQLDASSATFTEDLARLTAQSEELAERQADLREEIRGNTQEAGNAREAFGNLFTGLTTGNLTMAAAGLTGIKAAIIATTKSALAFIATPLGATIAVLAGIALATKEWFDYNKEVSKANKTTAAITKLSGDAMDEARIRSQSMAKSFDQDFEEILNVAGALVNEFGISYDEAFNRIENGLVKGGAANGEFLESMREYPTFFAKAGYSAEEFQNILNTGADLSIYQDKLPDAIKEFGLALTEETDTASEALQNAFGTEFTQKLMGGVKDGSITVREALYQVSAEAKRLGLNLQQEQQLTADLFKGAGEDAGGAMKIFEAMNKSIENQKRPLSEVEQAIKDLADSETDLARAQDEFLKSDGFSIWESSVKETMNNVMESFYHYLYVMTNSSEQVAADVLKGINNVTAESQKDFIDDATASFDRYVERRKKQLGKEFDYNEALQERIQQLQDSAASSKDEGYKEEIAATIKHLEGLGKIRNENNIKDIQAQTAANKKKAEELRRAQDIEAKAKIKAAEDLAKAERKAYEDRVKYFTKGNDDISALLKKSSDERDLNRLEGSAREKLAIVQKWDNEIGKYSDFAERRAELEAAKEAELYAARELRAKESAERVKEIELQTEGDRLQRMFTNSMYLAEYENENQMQRAVIAAQKAGASEEEIAAIKKQYAAKNKQTGVAALDFFIALKNSEVKFSKLGEDEKLALTKQGLNSAADMFNQGSAAWKALKIAEVTITTYQAAMNGYQSLSGIPIVGPALGAIAAALIVATGLKQVKQIASTKLQKQPKFFKGGYTGNTVIEPDEYGGVVGAVHKDEWVAPAYMTKNPRYANVIGWLENERVRTANGGSSTTPPAVPEFSGNSGNSGNSTNSDPEMKALLAAMLNRLDNPVAPAVLIGYQEVKEIEKLKTEITQADSFGKLNTL